jgi:hypothetical protein
VYRHASIAFAVKRRQIVAYEHPHLNRLVIPHINRVREQIPLLELNDVTRLTFDHSRTSMLLC